MWSKLSVCKPSTLGDTVKSDADRAIMWKLFAVRLPIPLLTCPITIKNVEPSAFAYCAGGKLLLGSNNSTSLANAPWIGRVCGGTQSFHGVGITLFVGDLECGLKSVIGPEPNKRACIQQEPDDLGCASGWL